MRFATGGGKSDMWRPWEVARLQGLPCGVWKPDPNQRSQLPPVWASSPTCC